MKKEDKLYMKGYKIFRADNKNRRRGVAILISTELDCKTYITEKDEDGRFIQVKLRNEEVYGEFQISSLYVEPENEKNKLLIPESIWESEHFGGDLNKMNSGCDILEKVYHIKNLGKLIESKKLPNIISDHPILLFELEINIPTKNEYYKITILDKNITNENDIELAKTRFSALCKLVSPLKKYLNKLPL